MLAAIADDALAPLPERAASPALAATPSEQVPEDMSPETAEPIAEPPAEPVAPQPVPVAPQPVPAPPSPAPKDMSSPPATDDLVEPSPGPSPSPVPEDRRPILGLGLAGGPLFGLQPDPGVRGRRRAPRRSPRFAGLAGHRRGARGWPHRCRHGSGKS
ncbi:hypothetical protein [Nannocystis pusilla]|uniref:hypothetical protein n=1 Tax=Nannocystis pusilla TaxID=889268 RepID=UPI003B817DE9